MGKPSIVVFVLLSPHKFTPKSHGKINIKIISIYSASLSSHHLLSFAHTSCSACGSFVLNKRKCGGSFFQNIDMPFNSWQFIKISSRQWCFMCKISCNFIMFRVSSHPRKGKPVGFRQDALVCG